MSSHNGPQYFPNVSNAVFNNPRITHVSGNAEFSSSERRGLKSLLKNISEGAFHDAAERGDPPKCHPHTRVAIRAEIIEWVKAPEARRKLVIWMYGPAGAGKTAIGQSIAEECKEQGLLAASFFFSRTAPGRNDTTRFVATIAYQISRFLPEIEDYLLTAIERDPTIFSRTLATQMKTLVIEPLNALSHSLKPIFVVLDGIDEISPNRQSQADLLNAIGMATSELRHIPLTFLIASRPEYEIREVFNGPLLSPLTHSLVLDDDYEANEDIKRYFDSTFQGIYDKHLRLGTRLPSPWPSTDDVDLLVAKASGQFIFAATVMKFVESVRHHPQERLDIILGLSAPGNETPFALLDVLYHRILSSVTDLPQVLEILAILLLPTHNYQFDVLFLSSRHADWLFGDGATPAMIDELLGFGVHRTLVDMHALVFVPPPTDLKSELRIHHASLADFLTDRSRSQNFFIDPSQGHLALSRRWSKFLAKNQFSIQLPFRHCITSFVYHCRKSPVIVEVANNLACFDLRRLLEEEGSDFYTIYSTPWKDFFECVQLQAGDRIDVFSRLQNEFYAFVLERLSKYPLFVRDYIPTLMVLSRAVRHAPAEIFKILLSGSGHCQSSMEYDNNLRLDSTLLKIHDIPWYGLDKAFSILFQDCSRVGGYGVYDVSYLELAKQIVSIIFAKSHEDGQQFKCAKFDFHRKTYFSDLGGSRRVQLGDLYFEWFPDMLSEASMDLDLARFLREHALQYGSGAELTVGRRIIAEASLKYIQRCGIPYLKHSHLPDANSCFICDECDGASVVDCTPIFPSSSLELSPYASEVNNHSNELGTPDSSALRSASDALEISKSLIKLKRKRGVQSSYRELRRSTRMKGTRTVAS